MKHKDSSERRECKRQNLSKRLLKPKDRSSLKYTDSKEKKKLKESDWREKLQLLSMKRELSKKDSKGNPDLNKLDKRL